MSCIAETCRSLHSYLHLRRRRPAKFAMIPIEVYVIPSAPDLNRAKCHLSPASLLRCTSLNALLPLRKVIIPTAKSTGKVLNKFQLV
jgi:hypothetical protein